MSKDEAIKELTELLPEEFLSEYTDAIKMGIEALKQEPCEDCVSRNAVLDLVADYDLSMGQVVKSIHALPPVTQLPKMGHWEKDEYGNIHCTFCGCNALYEKIHYPDDYFGKVVRAKSGFCPTCGAKMQEVRYGE